MLVLLFVITAKWEAAEQITAASSSFSSFSASTEYCWVWKQCRDCWGSLALWTPCQSSISRTLLEGAGTES